MQIYYDKQKLKNNELFCLGIDLTDEDIEKLKTEGIEYVIYTGNNLFSGYPFVEGNILRQATIKESIELEYIKLQEGEILNGDNEIVKVEKPSYQHKWDFTLQKWLPDEEKLYDGQYIEGEKIIDVPYGENLGYLIPVWDKETHAWEEQATEEEIKNFYFSQINKFKAEILEIGFLYIDKNDKPHQQKCREKDLSLLGNAIAAGEDTVAYSKKMKIVWSFNDGDILEMSLEDLKLLRIYGAVFVQTIFTVEAELKATEPNILLEKQDFISKVNELSEVKCYKEVL